MVDQLEVGGLSGGREAVVDCQRRLISRSPVLQDFVGPTKNVVYAFSIKYTMRARHDFGNSLVVVNE